jgi:hypothetical protein
MSTPQHDPLPDEGMIHEWLDGQLDDATSARLEALVQRSPEFAARVAEARGFVAASSRILSALDDVPAGVLPNRTAPAIAPDASTPDSGVRAITSARPQRPTFTWQRWASAAAVLLVAVTGTMVVQRDPEPASDVVAETATTARVNDSAAAPSTTPLGSPSVGGAAPASIARVTEGPPAASPRAATQPAAAAPMVAPLAVASDAPERATEKVASRAIGETSAERSSGLARTSSAEVAASTATADVAVAEARRGAPALELARAAAAAPIARSLAAAPEPAPQLSAMRSDLALDELQFAVQRVECAAQCRQVRVEIAADGRLRRWTSSLGRSSAPDSGRVSEAAVAQLVRLQDSLALSTLPPVVPLVGAQCRSVGSLRESLRLEFRHDGRLRAITSVPWCDAPEHPLAIMTRAVERAAEQPLGAPSP